MEKRSGIVIATVLDDQLSPGPQKVLWNGRTWTGALAFTVGAVILHQSGDHLDVGKLHGNSDLSDPLDRDFDYVKEFPYFRDQVLPRLERLGLRVPFKGLD